MVRVCVGGSPGSSAEATGAEHLPTCSESLSASLPCCNKSGAAINREQLAEVPPGFRRKHIQPDVLCLPTHCVFNWDVCSSGNCFSDYSTHSPSPPVWHSPSGQNKTQTSPWGPLTWPRRQLEICQAWPTGRCAFFWEKTGEIRECETPMWLPAFPQTPLPDPGPSRWGLPCLFLFHFCQTPSRTSSK